MDKALIKKLNGMLKEYIPKDFIPADDALYRSSSLFDMPLKEIDEIRFKVIKDAFLHHYEKNEFYHQHCKENGIKPDDIKDSSELQKIPLIPDRFYKTYPKGKDFAVWLSNIYTGEIPEVTIQGNHPSLDDIIDSFNNAGMQITYSSGTSGRHTFIPRDKRNYKATEYSIARSVLEMLGHWWEGDDFHAYLLFPNPKKTNIYVGKVTSVLFDVAKDVEVAIDREVTTKEIRIVMGRPGGIGERIMGGLARLTVNGRNKKMVDNIIKWMERYEKSEDKLLLAGAVFILHMVMEKLEEDGRTFDLGERAAVLTGGGWKAQEGQRMAVKDFRERVNRLLGIPEENCLDLYGMVEGSGFMVHCPEGHYLHIPLPFYYPMALDDDLNPLDYGETGRFAFLDGLARSYPGFIMTGDRVKILEKCPVCDRPGPVLEPEIHRMGGEEIRGCAEEMRRLMTRRK